MEPKSSARRKAELSQYFNNGELIETAAVEPPPIEQPAFSAASEFCARLSPFVGSATELHCPLSLAGKASGAPSFLFGCRG
jgi:hypothetical protein